MDEMTFRSKLMTHPQYLDDETLAYLEQNPDKKSVVQAARELDSQISDALDVEVPEGLHARILLKQSYAEGQEQPLEEGLNSHEDSKAGSLDVVGEKVVSIDSAAGNKTTWGMSWLFGLAASFLVVTIGLNFWPAAHHGISSDGSGIVNHIVAHIEEDPTLMTAIKLPETDEEMNKLFARVGAQLNQPVEGMSYAGMCVVEGQEGLHIVMQQNGEAVTVIVMPGQQMEAMTAFNKSGYQGQLIPVKGGVVAIVANTQEQLALAQIRFFKAVKFA